MTTIRLFSIEAKEDIQLLEDRVNEYISRLQVAKISDIQLITNEKEIMIMLVFNNE